MPKDTPKHNPITAMVESPKGYGQKFDFDPGTRSFKLSKILPAGMVFPFDFGMIPETKGEDDDPLDIIVVSENGTFPGCLIKCRIIGALRAGQTEGDGTKVRNDRFVSIPTVSRKELPPAILNQVEHFFRNYNEQAGKCFEVTGQLEALQAIKLIEHGTTT